MRISILTTFASIVLVAGLSSCGTPAEKAANSVEEAVKQLERTADSFDQTVKVLEGLKGSLDDETYKRQVEDLIRTTGQVSQLSVQGSLDFTRTRLSEDLGNIKRKIEGRDPLPRVPVFSNAQSKEIDFSSESRSAFTIIGWNLDVAALDPEFKVTISNADAGERQVDRQFLNFAGQYALTINTSGSGVPLQHGDNKMVIAGLNSLFEIAIINSGAPPAAIAKRLRVMLVYTDVYLDGSGGKDRWSTWLAVNGQVSQVWDRKRDISDNGTKVHGPGPGGDKNCTRYVVNFSAPAVSVNPDEELVVKFHGKAHDDGDPVKESTLKFDRSNNWGIGQGAFRGEGKHLHRMGERHRGDTEYFVYFAIEEI